MTLRLAIALAWTVLPSLQAEPIISEFMASNSDVLADGDGNYPDWIEIHNPDAVEIDLAGWGLRDDMETWRFPVGTSIPGGGYLVVFASGQAVEDYVDGAGHLHTTFKLDASGESLSLLRSDDSVAFDQFPVVGHNASIPARNSSASTLISSGPISVPKICDMRT